MARAGGKSHRWAEINVRVIIIVFTDMTNPKAISSDVLSLLSSFENAPFGDGTVGRNIFQE